LARIESHFVEGDRRLRNRMHGGKVVANQSSAMQTFGRLSVIRFPINLYHFLGSEYIENKRKRRERDGKGGGIQIASSVREEILDKRVWTNFSTIEIPPITRSKTVRIMLMMSVNHSRTLWKSLPLLFFLSREITLPHLRSISNIVKWTRKKNERTGTPVARDIGASCRNTPPMSSGSFPGAEGGLMAPH